MKLPEFVAGPAQQIRTVDPGQAAAMGEAIGRVGGAMMDVAQAQQKYQQRIKAERTAHEAALTNAYVEGEMARWEQDYGADYLPGSQVDSLMGDDHGISTTELVSDDKGNVVSKEAMVPKREYYPKAWEKKYRSVIEVAASKLTDPVMRERFIAAANADLETKKAEFFREGEKEARDERVRTESALIETLLNQGKTGAAVDLINTSQYMTPGEKEALKHTAATTEELWGWRETLLSGSVEEKAALARELRADGAEWLNKPETVIAIANQLEADVRAEGSGGAGENLEKAQRQYTTNMQKQIGVAVNGLKGAEREAQVNSIYRELISDPEAVNMMTAEGFKYLQEWHKTNGFMESDPTVLGQLEAIPSADLARMSDEEFDVYLLKLNPEDQAKWEQARAKAQTQTVGGRTKADDIKTARDQRFVEVFGPKPDPKKKADDYKVWLGNQRAYNALMEEEARLRIEANGGRDLNLTEYNEVLDSVTMARRKLQTKTLFGLKTTEAGPMGEIYLPVAHRALQEYNRQKPRNVPAMSATTNDLWLLEKAAHMDGSVYENYKNLRNQWQEATR